MSSPCPRGPLLYPEQHILVWRQTVFVGKRVTNFFACMYRFFVFSAGEQFRLWRLRLEARRLRLVLKDFAPLDLYNSDAHHDFHVYEEFSAEQKQDYKARALQQNRLQEIERKLNPLMG